LTLDSKKYKETECQSWDSVANNWQKWWKTIEIGAEDVSRRLIELAEIKPGSRVLDIATGIGEPAITAANQMGNNGHILATDISSQMLSVAKQRAISLGLQNVIEFKEGDTETIELSSSTFDAVLCRWGMTLFLDFDTGLSNIYRSLVDGSRIAAAVWSSADKVPVLAIAVNTVMKETNSPPPPSPKVAGPFSLSDENMLKNSFIKSASFRMRRLIDTPGNVKSKWSAISVGVITSFSLSSNNILLLLSSESAFQGEPIIVINTV
jgi:ubiquinone/menaquinone biosynthesis C-methylase UbiE